MPSLRALPSVLTVAALSAVSGSAGLALAQTAPAMAVPGAASIVDLGPPTGMAASQAGGVDAQGMVGGTLVPSLELPGGDAALWIDGSWRDLGSGSVLGVTATGQAVGYTGPSERAHAAVWTSGGQLRDLGTLPGGAWSQATAANARGAVVGYAQSSTTHAFRWQGQALEDLGASASGPSYAYGINDAGQVVGSADDHAVEWDTTGRLIDLGAGPASVAYAINSSGEVVGTVRGQAFAWSPAAGLQLLPLPAGAASGASVATAVDDAGRIVGSGQVSSGTDLPVFHALLWQGGQAIDLNQQLPADSGWELGSAVAINAAGEIVGTGVSGGVTRAFALRLASE